MYLFLGLTRAHDNALVRVNFAHVAAFEKSAKGKGSDIWNVGDESALHVAETPDYINKQLARLAEFRLRI
jgi:hypothetical protein